MKEFNKLFNIFTVLAIIIMLLTTVVAASVTVIEKGKSNLYSVIAERIEFQAYGIHFFSANTTINEFPIREYCINLV